MPWCRSGEEHVQVLDGLRGLAALMVVASHASNMGVGWVPGVSLSGIGKHGVFLFFVLSAFLLSTRWMAIVQARQALRPAVSSYLIGRFFRIYPLYVLVLLVGWALQPRGLGVPMDGEAVARHLLLMDGREIYWSIPVEFQFYLALPLVAGLLATPLPIWLRLSVWGALVALTLWYYPPDLAPLNSPLLGYYLPVFLIGSLAAWAQGLSLAARVRHRVSMFDLIVFLALILSTPAVWSVLLQVSTPPDFLHRATVAWGAGWAAVVVGLVWGHLPLCAQILSGAPLRLCGRWSFGLYLLHIPALAVAKRVPMAAPLQGLLGLAIAICLANLAYRLIEAPALRCSARWR